jgi:hypothetical protein
LPVRINAGGEPAFLGSIVSDEHGVGTSGELADRWQRGKRAIRQAIRRNTRFM